MPKSSSGVQVGDKGSMTMIVTQADIARFADFCGDAHPMHLDPEYASKTRFGRTVAHGIVPLALISAVLGTKIGGPDVTVVQLGQTARFLRPVYPGDTITATCEVTEVNPDRPVAILACTCTNDRGQHVLTGDTTIMLDPMPYDG